MQKSGLSELREMTMAEPLVKNEFFSHGTYECNNMPATRRFLVDFLGLDIVRPLKEAQYMWKGGSWSVVCVCVQDGDADVDAARAAALAHKDDYGIKRVFDIEETDGHRSFKLLDLNNTWWEISTVSQAYYDEVFARGDARA
jgi:hypothetical protein